MRVGFAHPRGAELEERFAQGSLPVGIAGFATRREHDRHRGLVAGALEADNIEIGEAELVGGVLGQDIDAKAVEPLEKSAGFRLEIAWEIEDDALIERSEQEAVAVALEAFEHAVAEGPIHIQGRRPAHW
jgi:hypothetical protein